MTEIELKMKKIIALADVINMEINRMCVTDDLAELDTMALHAGENLKKLHKMRYELSFKNGLIQNIKET